GVSSRRQSGWNSSTHAALDRGSGCSLPALKGPMFAVFSSVLIFDMAGRRWTWSTGWEPERDLQGRPADEVAEIVSGILAAVLREWQVAYGRGPKPYDPVPFDAPLSGG